MAFTNTKNKKTTFTRLLWVLVCMFSIQLTFSKNIYVNNGSTTRDLYCTAIGNVLNSGLTPALPKATLAAALTIALAGDTIYIDTGTYSDSALTISKALTIVGAGPGNTIFNGNALPNRFATITANNVTIKNLTLIKYYLQLSDGQVITMTGLTGILFENVVVKDNPGSPTSGVNFLLSNSTVTLRACLFSCSGWNADGGGAFRADNSTVLVDYCIFKNSKNFANSGQGGAIELSGASNVTIKNTVFDECSAQMGGAIFQGIGVSTLTVTNSKFVNNFTAGDGSDPLNGGGAFASKAAAGSISSFTNCVFTNNKVDRDGDQNASSDGGAILFRSASGTFVFNKCSFSNISTSSYDKGQDFYISKGTSLTGSISNCTFSPSTNASGGNKVNIYNLNLLAADYSVTNSNTWTRTGTAPAITDALAPVWDPTFSAPNTPTPNTANLVACGVVANCATDINPPLIIKCVDDKTLYCPNSLPDYRAEVSVFDDCTTTIVQSPLPGVVLTVGSNTVTMTVTDFNGNVSTCTFIVTVVPAPPATNFGDFASAVQITANAVSEFKNTSGAVIADLIGPVSFSGSLGSFVSSSGTLKLTGAEIKTRQNNPGTVCSSAFYWIVYPSGSRPANPTFSTFAIPYKIGCIDSDANSVPDKFGDLLGPCTSFNDKKWSTVAQAIDLTAYTNGNYTLETYYSYTGSETGDCVLDAKTQYINNSCGNYTADFTLSVASCTNPVISVQPILTQTNCLNSSSTQISVTATGTTLTYQWYSNTVNNVTTGTLLPLETNSTFTPPSNSVGTLYYYCIVSSVPCSVTTTTSTVVTNANPDAPIVGTITPPTCTLATGSVALSGLPATGTWTVNTIPSGFTTTGTGATTIFSGLTAGTYNFTVTNASTCTSAPSASSAIITIPLVIPNAPIVGTITPPTCTLATGSVALSGLPSGTWTVTTIPSGFTTTGTGTTTTFSGLVAGTYTFTVTNAVGCTSVASASSATINIQPVTPTAPIVGAITQPTCALATGSVALSGLPATGTWTVNTIPGGFTTTGTGTAGTVTGLTAGQTYTFTVTNASGCTSFASANAIVNTQPITPTAPTGATTQAFCAINTPTVASLSATGTGIIWYATATSTTALSSTDLLISGNYYATQTIGICESDTRLIVAVAVTEIPNVILFEECDGTDYTITATTLNAEIGLTYEWFNAMNMSQNIGSSVSLVISVEGTYIVRITKNGCSEDFSVIVDNSYCGIPNGISPNDDDLNDNFDLSNFKVKNLQIFNRYGMEMYRKANYVNEWAGQTNDGQELPDGTYYYIIEFQNKSVKVGWVYKNSEY